MDFFGVRLIGLNAESARKLLLTVAVLLVLWVLSRLLRAGLRAVFAGRRDVAASFWSRQAVHIVLAFVFIISFASIWFDRPGRIGSMAGLITAGLAVALGRVVTALAGYFVILRSRIFNIGDRIAMAGVRGDVISLSFLRTTILEMGQPPGEEENDPDVWIGARQYTGRIVTVTNDKVFDEPVYNYSREFPFIFEELKIGIAYDADRDRAEQIIVEAATRHSEPLEQMAEEAIHELRRRYFVAQTELHPRVYFRLTDNWLEMSVRFITSTHGIREVKDRIARDILKNFDEAGLQVASTTVQIVGLPPVRLSSPAGPAQ